MVYATLADVMVFTDALSSAGVAALVLDWCWFFLWLCLIFLYSSYRCFTFNGKDMMPTIEEYSMMIRLNLQSLDKVYYRRMRMRIRKKLVKIMKVKPEDAEGYIVNKEGSVGLSGTF